MIKVKQTYIFKDVFIFTKNKSIPVKNEDGVKVGTILRAFNEEGFTNHTELRKGTFYAYQDERGDHITSFAVKKKGWKAVLGYEYELFFAPEEKIYHLADAKGLIYLYFHVKGKIGKDHFEVHEDWDGKILLKINKEKYAYIIFDKETYEVRIVLLNDAVAAIYKHPAFLSLMYCIYRLYNIETTIIDEILGEFT